MINHFADMKIGVIGAGSFGTALAVVLSEKASGVHLWSHSRDIIDSIQKQRKNLVYMPDVELPPNIVASTDMKEVMRHADIIVSVVPTQATREVWDGARKLLEPGSRLVMASKGIEKKSHLLVSDIMLEILGEEIRDRLFFLSGPSFARELVLRKPTAITIAGYNKAGIEEIQQVFRTSYFRAYGTTDVVGVELGGALKNVIAIAAGVSDGLDMGFNARAGLITRGLAEIARLGRKLGADPLTFMGLAGLGDLVLTCTGQLSRNLTLGMRIARGESLQEIESSMRMIAEGVPTTESAYELAQMHGIDMPITSGVYSILYQGVNPRDAYLQLMERDLKFESEEN